MSGSTKTTDTNQQQGTQAQTATNAIDPAQLAMLTANYQGAQGRANSLTPYTGPLTAGFTPTQTQAQGVLTGVATDPTFQNNNTAALNGAQGVLSNNYNTNVNAPTVTAGLLAKTDLTPYMNPFQNDVINASINQNERARQMAQVGDSQQETASGAFGGSRSGVAASLTNGEYDRNDQTNIANLNAENFTQAQAGATGDINRTLGADTTNANNSMTAQQQSINNMLAKQGLQLNAAGQIEQLNNNGLALATQQGGILSGVGDAQQAQHQQELTDAYNAYTQGQQLTVQQQQMLNSALGLIPNQQTISSSGTNSSSGTGTVTQVQNPGLLDYINAAAGVGKAAAGLNLSDGRTKSDIETIRHDAHGRRWVSFRYNWEPEGTFHEGVIAQEILQSDPDAVILGNDGLYRVDYSKLRSDA